MSSLCFSAIRWWFASKDLCNPVEVHFIHSVTFRCTVTWGREQCYILWGRNVIIRYFEKTLQVNLLIIKNIFKQRGEIIAKVSELLYIF